MKRAPLPVIVISVLIMLSGAFGLYGAWLTFVARPDDHSDALLAAAVNVLGIVAGVFVLRGHNWARWLAVAWMGFHVAISFGHPRQELIVHSILLVLFAYGLFRADARPFFSSKSTAA
jgi:hypothetical protein